MNVYPFSWSPTVKSVSATSTSSGVALAGVGNVLLICNSGTNTCYFRLGTGSATAVTTDFPLTAGAYLTFTINPTQHTYLAAITNGSDTAVVRIMQGEGI